MSTHHAPCIFFLRFLSTQPLCTTAWLEAAFAASPTEADALTAVWEGMSVERRFAAMEIRFAMVARTKGE